MKQFARTQIHRWHGFRKWMARRLLETFETGAPAPWWASLAFAGYGFKRWLQDAVLGQLPAERLARRWRSRLIASQYLMKLTLWADRPIGERFEPHRACRANNRLTEIEREEMRARAESFEYRPLISVLVPVFNAKAEWIDRLVDSVIGQTYDRWELVLVDDGSTAAETAAALAKAAEQDDRIVVEPLAENAGVASATNRAAEIAHGEFLAFLDHDDELTPDALWWMADHLQSRPNDDLLYSDEELVEETGRAHGVFKPGFAPELMTAYNYMCHLVVVRKSVFDAVGRLRPGTEGAQDYDLLLRVIHQTDRVSHVPRICYRWWLAPQSMSRRVDPSSREIQPNALLDPVTRRVVQDHLDRLGAHARADIVDHWARPTFQPVDLGKVSVIVCTRDQPRLLWRAVRSIEKNTDYPNYEIVIVDNDSRHWLTRWALRRLGRRHRVIRLSSGPEGFNFSRLNNEAARLVDGKYLLFLNDDTCVRTRQWLSAMVGYLQFADVGAVGARLLFPNQLVQHVGLVVGAMGWGPWHAMRGFQSDRSDLYAGYATHPHNALAVTGACLLTPRALFAELEGFDERRFAVSFNDVDYCLRLATRGLRCVVATQAELIHWESQTRDVKIQPAEAAAFRERYPNVADPYWNPHYTRETPHFLPSGRRRARRLFADRPPRVLLTHRPWRWGDPWPNPEPLFDALAKRGHCALERERVADPWDDRWSAELRRELYRGDYDVLVAHGVDLAPAIEAADAVGLPAVWSIPQLLTLPERADHWQSARFVRTLRALPLAYQVAFTNAFDKSWANAGAPRENFCVIEGTWLPGGARADRESARRGFGIDRDDVAFLMHCPSLTDGSLDWALDGFQRLPRRLAARARMTLVVSESVNGATFLKLRRRIRRLGPRISLLAGPEETAPLIAATDALIVSPRPDVRAGIVLEALAQGIATIGPSELFAADVLYPGRTGQFVTPGDGAGLATAMSRWIERPEELSRAKSDARHWLDSRAHPELVLEQWGELLLEASELREDRAPPPPLARRTSRRGAETGASRRALLRAGG